MPIDTLINEVDVLIQDGGATNVATAPSWAGGLPVVITSNGIAPAAGYLLFAPAGTLELSRSAYTFTGSCVELVLTQTWTPDAVLLRGATSTADLGGPAGPDRPIIYADPYTPNRYFYAPRPGVELPFVLPPAPTKALLRVQYNGYGVRFIEVVPETGVPFSDATTTHNINDWDYVRRLPMTLGAMLGGRAVPPAPEATAAAVTLVPAREDGVRPSIERIRAVDIFPDESYENVNIGNALLSIATVGIWANGTNLATITQHNTTRSEMTALVVARWVEIQQNSGYPSASYAFDGNEYRIFVPPVVFGGPIDAAFGVTADYGYYDYPVLGSRHRENSSTFVQASYFAPGPSIPQTVQLSVFVADPSKQYEVTIECRVGGIWDDYASKTELICGGEPTLTGLTRLLAGTGIVWTETTPGAFTCTHTFPDFIDHPTSLAIREIAARPSAIEKLYALRITNGFRSETDFPTLPWPTSNVEVPPSTGVPPDVRYYFPFLSSETTATSIPNRGSITAFSLPVTSGSVTPGGVFVNEGAWVGGSDTAITPIVGNCTLEFWFKYEATSPVGGLVGLANFGVLILAGQLSYLVGENPVSVCPVPPASGWHHVAMVRSEVGMQFYLDGTTQMLGTADMGAIGSDLSGLRFGGAVPSSGNMTADVELDDVIVTGGAKYTTDFSPKARGAALDGIICLALNFETGTNDLSDYARPQAAAQNFSLAPGGSRTGDRYLRANDISGVLNYQFPIAELNGLDECTYEFDAFIPMDSVTGGLYALGWSGARYVGFYGPPGDPITVTFDGATFINSMSASSISTEGIAAGVWHHIACVVDGVRGESRVFVDGVRVRTELWSGGPGALSIDSNESVFCVLRIPDCNANDQVRLDNILITKQAKYLTDFTPPTSGVAVQPDVGGAQYTTLQDWTSTGTGHTQAFYLLSQSVTLEDFTVACSSVVDGNFVDLTGAATLNDWTATGSGLAAVSTDLSGAVTLDGWVTSGTGMASPPLFMTGTAVLGNTTQLAYATTLAPVSATGAIFLQGVVQSGTGVLTAAVSATGTIFLQDVLQTGEGMAIAAGSIPVSGVVVLQGVIQTAVAVVSSGAPGYATGGAQLQDVAQTGSGEGVIPITMSGGAMLDDVTQVAVGAGLDAVIATSATVLDDVIQMAFGAGLDPAVGTSDVVLGDAFNDGYYDGFGHNSGWADVITPQLGQIACTMPAPVVTATGGLKQDKALATMPVAQAMSWGHTVVLTTLPRATASSSGIVVNTAGVDAVMPMPVVDTAGRVAWGGEVLVDCPSFLATAHGGGAAQASLARAAVSASGTSGGVARIAARMPMPLVVASIVRVNAGQIAAQMPALVPIHGASIRAVMPMQRAFVFGNAPSPTSTREAYALNLAVAPEAGPKGKPQAKVAQMTRYTNYPFTRIVRFKGAYYGVAATGMYRLGGDTDAGAPIAWSIETCVTHFGATLQKNVASVYLGGSAGPEVDFTVRSGETPDMLHPYTTTATAVQRNHRQPFGRGRRTRYYSFRLSSSAPVELDSLEFEVVNTTRRI